MKKSIKYVSFLNVIINVFLFLIKITAGFFFSNMSLIADSFNSLTDIISATIICFTVKINNLKADSDHQFGHSRAENIAGYTIGILMIVLAFNLFLMVYDKIINHVPSVYNNLLLLVSIITLVCKIGMFFIVGYVLKHNDSPALKANRQDHLNDVFIISSILLSIILLRYSINLDIFFATIIGIYILINGIKICFENINHLMGIKAPDDLIEKIKMIALSNKDVKGLNDIFTQYLGNKIQVEIHIEVNNQMTIKQAHDIANSVKKQILKLEFVNNCFVHIDEYKNM